MNGIPRTFPVLQTKGSKGDVVKKGEIEDKNKKYKVSTVLLR